MMRKKGLLACTTLVVLAMLLVPTFSAFAWDGNIDKDVDCENVVVTADPANWDEDKSGSSRIQWRPVTVVGEGTFPWGTLQTSMNGTVTITWLKWTSNNSGATWTATSVYHDESFNWSANRPGNCQITICHVDGLASNPANYQTLTLSINGAKSHFNENGTPKAGHEDDSLGVCNPPPPPPVLGCMDPDAINYNPEATQDDGSCQYPPPPVPGCTDPQAINYNPDATEDDGSCQYPPEEIPGCTDPNALNYNQEATVDDGSCEYPPPPTDVCPNLEGDQAEIPAGMIIDNDGNCVPEPEPELTPYCLDNETVWLPVDADPPEGATPGECTPPPTPQPRPHEEPATGPEGALPLAEGIAFLAMSGLAAFGIRRMKH